jgi:hypothetical protein
MKRALFAIAILVLMISIGLASFVSGYLYREYDFTSDAQMEDYALTNILTTIANKEFFSEFESSEFKQETDINIDRHLIRVRRSTAFKNNKQLAKSRLEVLNMAYCYWRASPPFYPDDFGGDVFWVEEWRENHTANLELVSRAHKEWVKKGGGACPNP